jgi:predicted DsbA family dithiol-disulfide isomerase/Skp family chaperone for outer membrane proteins
VIPRSQRTMVAASGLVLLATSFAIGQSVPKQLAVVNGEVVTEDQIRGAAKDELESLEAQRVQFEASYAQKQYDIIDKALNEFVDDRVLEAEAKKRGITKQALMEAEVDAKVQPPTEGDVNRFYEANKAKIGASLAEVQPRIVEYLMDQKRQPVYSEFMGRLRKDYKVETYLEPHRIEVATAGFPTRGPVDAPVTIVEFSDFECPYCGNLYPTLKLIESNYAERVKVVYRQFPLTNIHPNAQKAAEASLCANDQQKFWELHDAMFQDQQHLTVEALKRKAEQLKMDSTVFNECLDSGKHAETIRKDIIDGVRAGVSGTPAMFINGRFLSGAYPYGDISKVIDEELRKSQSR